MPISLAPMLGAAAGSTGGTVGSGDFLNNFMSTRFGGVPSRDASNAAELEAARQAGNKLGLFPDALIPLKPATFFNISFSCFRVLFASFLELIPNPCRFISIGFANIKSHPLI